MFHCVRGKMFELFFVGGVEHVQCLYLTLPEPAQGSIYTIQTSHATQPRISAKGKPPARGLLLSAVVHAFMTFPVVFYL